MVLGTGLAVASGPQAGADPIDDAWPYPGFYLQGGYIGPPTNGIDLGLIGFGDRVYDSSTSDPLYSTHDYWLNIPFLTRYDHQTVFDSTGFDAVNAIPSDGTVSEELGLGLIPNFFSLGFTPIFDNKYITDPMAGTGDQFTIVFFTQILQNTYISDDAGVRDVLSIFGQDYTLFDIPAASAAAVTPDAADAFTDLAAAVNADWLS